MKTLKLKVAISSPKDMNELVDTVCKIMNQDTSILRDKFKMVTQANSKSLNDLCKELRLKLTFDYTGKNTACVEVLVNEGFNILSLEGKEEVRRPNKKEDSPKKIEEPADDVDNDDPF